MHAVPIHPNGLPRIGLGTYRLKGTQLVDAVTQALALGYRHVDTAQIYDNESEVGEAIDAARLPRDGLFVTTKVWIDHLHRDAVGESLARSLDRLRLDRIDLALVHWPSPGGTVPLAETIEGLQLARARGLIRHFGVSNFTGAMLREAVSIAGAGAVFTNQVELHPYLQNRALAAVMRAVGVPLTSYMTLGYGAVLADPVIASIAAAHAATPAQVVLAWAMQQGIAVIPSSTQRVHQVQNLAACELRLREDDMARLAALDRGGRLVDIAGLAPAWD